MKGILFSLIPACLFSVCCYSQDSTVKKTVEVAPENIIFTKVEVEAEFPGGIEGWSRYLQKNLNARVPIKKKAKNGTYQVIVRFIVSKDGSIKDVTAETNHGHGMEQEVIRVIEDGPKWTPAMQNGKPVNAFRRQPVTFVVSGK